MPSDIAKCAGERVNDRVTTICLYRDRCYRFTSEPSPIQTYMEPPLEMGECKDFMDTEPPEAA